jgi:hypothetical protein
VIEISTVSLVNACIEPGSTLCQFLVRKKNLSSRAWIDRVVGRTV